MASVTVHAVASTSSRHRGRLTIVCALFFLLTFTSALQMANALSVNSVACKTLTSDAQGSCASGSPVTFVVDVAVGVAAISIGSTDIEKQLITCPSPTVVDNTITCHLSLDAASAKPGIYPVSLTVDGVTAAAGSLAVGDLHEFSVSAFGFSNGWRDVQPSANEIVSGFSTSSPVSGELWTVYGNFDPQSTYKVLFYSDVDMGMIHCGGDADAVTPSVAQSQGKIGFANALVCTMTSTPGTMGMFTLLVLNVRTGAFVPGTTGLYMIDVSPPLPTITAVSGGCAEDSAACVTGATLTFVGSNFNDRKPEYNNISIVNTAALVAATGASDTASGITCTPTAVSATSLTCTLTVGTAAEPGSFAVYARVHVCTHRMLSIPAYLGNLVYGRYYGVSVPGLTIGHTDMATGSQVIEGKSDGYVFSGGWLAVFGTFDATHDYTVVLYNTQAAGTGVPTCTTVVKQKYLLNCTGVMQPLGNLGMYRVLVKDNTANFYLPTVTTKMSAIMVFAPLPTFTSAAGPCAENSVKCVTGAELAFTGTNFVADKKMSITFDRDGITCTPGPVSSATTARCTLSVDSGVPAGEYRMYVSVQGCAMGMMTPPNAAGFLVLANSRSSSANAAAAITPGWKATTTTSDPVTVVSKRGQRNVAAVVCAVVFGILTLAFAIAFAVVTYMFCRNLKHSRDSLSSGSYPMELVGAGGRGDPFTEEKQV